MNKRFPKQTESIMVKDVVRLTMQDFQEMDRLLIANERAKIVIVKNKSGIHIDFRSYKHRYNEK